MTASGVADGRRRNGSAQGRAAFFEPQPLAPQELLDRVVRHTDAAPPVRPSTRAASGAVRG